MHLKDDILRAFIDGELTPDSKKNTAEHLAECPACSYRLNGLEIQAQKARTQLHSLSPLTHERLSSPESALNSFYRRKEAPMTKIFRRPAWIAAGLVLALGIALLFPPVQALAGSFLGLFRVQQIQVITYDPASLERFNNSDANAMLEAFFNENMTTTTDGEYTQVTSREEAAAVAGFTPRLPAGAEISSLGVEAGQQIEINIDSVMMNAGLESFGYAGVKIPSDLDGQKIVASLPRAIYAAFGNCSPGADANAAADSMVPCMTLVQVPAPTITAPDSFPVVQLGEVVLQMLGMNEEQARQYSLSLDWTSTLIVPLPTGQRVASYEIPIDGTTGTIVRDDEHSEYVILWVKDGILYGLSGSEDSSPATRLAATLD